MIELRRHTFQAPAGSRAIVVYMHTNLTLEEFNALADAREAKVTRLASGTLQAEWNEGGMTLLAFGPRPHDVEEAAEDPTKLEENG